MILSDEYRRLHYPDAEAVPACAGEHDLFDPPAPHEATTLSRERADLARKICRYCTILDGCADLAASLHKRVRAGFTYAGVTYNSVGEPTTSSSKDTAA